MSAPLIQLRGIEFAYPGAAPILRGLDFDLHDGERVALLGPNGCGKTTLLHLIVGLLRPQAGEIHAFGCPRRAERDFLEVRRKTALMFQDPDDQLFCPTVAEDVAFGPLNLGATHDEAVAIVRETLDLLGLTAYEKRITYKLSDGEKRLVALATVLAMRPAVLLLDEPTAGLDDDIRERIVAVLDRLPLSLVVISHDADFVRRTAARTCRWSDGRIEPAAPPLSRSYL